MIKTVILPEQFVESWKPKDSDSVLKVLYYLDLKTLGIKKTYVEFSTFKSLEIRSFISAPEDIKIVELSFDEDDYGRMVVKSSKIIDTIKSIYKIEENKKK